MSPPDPAAAWRINGVRSGRSPVCRSPVPARRCAQRPPQGSDPEGDATRCSALDPASFRAGKTAIATPIPWPHSGSFSPEPGATPQPPSRQHGAPVHISLAAAHRGHLGKSQPPSRPDHALQIPRITTQLPAAEKLQRGQGLVLGRGAHVRLCGQLAQGGIDLRFPWRVWRSIGRFQLLTVERSSGRCGRP